MARSRIYNRRTKTAPYEGYEGPIIDYPLQHTMATAWASGILPKAFVSVLDFSEGNWSAPLPEQTPKDVANDFKQAVLPEPPMSEWEALDANRFGSGTLERMAANLKCTAADLVIVPKPSLVLVAAEWAIDHLSSSPSALVLIREMNAKPRKAAAKWASSMGIFYPVSESDVDRDSLADLMDLAADVTGDFMLLTSNFRLDPSASQSLLDSDLEELVAQAHDVVLGAYDGEGYVRWSRAF